MTSKIFRMLGAAVAITGSLANYSAAAENDYPTDVVELSVGQPAGGSLDVLARIVAEGLQKHFNQTFIVVNRPGGGGNVAGEYMTHQEPDGYNLLVLGSSMSFRQALGTTPFEFPNDFTTIARFGMMASTVAVPADLPVNSIEEFVAWTKEQPDGANYSSAGVGSGAHIFTMDFADKTDANLVHIPYTGGPAAVNALINNEVSLFLGPYTLVKGFVDAGEVKILATATPQRLPQLPDVPTMTEAGFDGFEAEQYIGLWGPKGMSEDIVNQLNAAVNDHLNTPEIQAQFKEISIRTKTESPEEFSQFLTSDVERWTKVVAKIKE